MIKSCFLITPIAPSYLRNNRSTRQKSLRCFPTCSPRGHITGGFCGQSMRAQLTLNVATTDRKFDIDDFVFICEIRPHNEPRISGEIIVRKASVMDKVRSKQDKDIGKELFMGEVNSFTQGDNEVEMDIVFNVRHHSWDYSWKSNRWSDQQHVVDIIVLTYESQLDYRVAGYFTSSQFMILSSHKKSTKGGNKSSSAISLPRHQGNHGSASETADQDLLEASNALSMLSGGLMPPAASTGKAATKSKARAKKSKVVAAEEENDEEEEESGDSEDNGSAAAQNDAPEYVPPRRNKTSTTSTNISSSMSLPLPPMASDLVLLPSLRPVVALPKHHSGDNVSAVTLAMAGASSAGATSNGGGHEYEYQVAHAPPSGHNNINFSNNGFGSQSNYRHQSHTAAAGGGGEPQALEISPLLQPAGHRYHYQPNASAAGGQPFGYNYPAAHTQMPYQQAEPPQLSLLSSTLLDHSNLILLPNKRKAESAVTTGAGENQEAALNGRPADDDLVMLMPRSKAAKLQ